MPSEATLRCVLNALDIIELEQKLDKYTQSQIEKSESLQGLAMDGKQLRDTVAHGEKVHLMNLATHSEGIVLDQVQVEEKTNEIGSAPCLLEGHSLSGFVVTGDAMFGQKGLAHQIVSADGEYLLQIKANQPETYDAIGELFDDDTWQRGEHDTNITYDQNHGRQEKRTVWTSTTLNEWLKQELGWDGVGQVVKRRCERENIKSGEKRTDTPSPVLLHNRLTLP